MFTIDQIKAAQAHVKSGADFPKFVLELIKLEVAKYNTYVSDGHTEYFGKGDYRIQSPATANPVRNIAAESNIEKFKQRLKIHQQGQTTYPTFCNDCAETGVEKWTVDMSAMTCTYFDKTGNEMLVERIPTA